MAGGLTTTYQYVNGQLLGEEHSDGTALRFTYDPFGALSGIQYKSAYGSTTDYYVRCTLNGDVDQIYDTSGNLLARYIYDSWGRTVSILNGSGQEILTGDHIAVVNPIRYRGYYYDGESGLYYLQSRYYDAKTGRYVNPDGYVYTGQDMQSGNMYAYCGNNPIINIDPTGSMYVRGARDVVGVDTQEFTPVPKGKSAIGSLLGSVFGAAYSVVSQYSQSHSSNTPVLNYEIGTRYTTRISGSGDSSKPISVYAIGRTDNTLLSSAGLNLNFGNFSLNLSLGLDNLGLSGGLANQNTTSSFALKADLSKFRVGLEMASTTKWDEVQSVTEYANLSIDGFGLLLLGYAIATGGQQPIPVG